jgi:hypothetical protein
METEPTEKAEPTHKIDPTHKELFFKKSMGVLCILFLIGALLFGLIPDKMLSTINWTGSLVGLQAPLVPSRVSITKDMWDTQIDKKRIQSYSPTIRSWPGARLWVALAVSMMVMIAFIAGMNFINPRKYIGWIPLLLISKGTSSALGLAYFFFHAKFLSNLILTIVDFPIFLFVLVIWLRARSAQKELE